MPASRYCYELIPPSTTPWSSGQLMISAASMPTSRCCCGEPSTRPGECRRGLDPCLSGADHPLADPVLRATSGDGSSAQPHICRSGHSGRDRPPIVSRTSASNRHGCSRNTCMVGDQRKRLRSGTRCQGVPIAIEQRVQHHPPSSPALPLGAQRRTVCAHRDRLGSRHAGRSR
jgi:hypothetical protein